MHSQTMGEKKLSLPSQTLRAPRRRKLRSWFCVACSSHVCRFLWQFSLLFSVFLFFIFLVRTCLDCGLSANAAQFTSSDNRSS